MFKRKKTGCTDLALRKIKLKTESEIHRTGLRVGARVSTSGLLLATTYNHSTLGTHNAYVHIAKLHRTVRLHLILIIGACGKLSGKNFVTRTIGIEDSVQFHGVGGVVCANFQNLLVPLINELRLLFQRNLDHFQILSLLMRKQNKRVHPRSIRTTSDTMQSTPTPDELNGNPYSRGISNNLRH